MLLVSYEALVRYSKVSVSVGVIEQAERIRKIQINK